MKPEIIQFPNGFTWGAATSSYQVEGAVNEDGRGASIWDTFCHTPGKVHNGDTGDIAADHYHRVDQDMELVSTLGLNAYRFSVAWPRIQPQGRGAINAPGLDFYDRLVDRLLEKNIRPYLTLYHWDLPQTLQDAGGWANRATAYRFAEYAQIMVNRLGDRVKYWITHNEPWVTAMLGYYIGEHAPGLTDMRTALQATHHLLLSHGLAVQALRAAQTDLNIGITLNLTVVHPGSSSEADRQAAWRQDGFNNRIFLDPVYKGAYPQDIVRYFEADFPETPAEDMELIRSPIEFLGINYYTRGVVVADPAAPMGVRHLSPEGNEYSQMWEIYPDGLYELLTRVTDDYQPASIYVTENGIPVADGVDADGRVRDYRRIRYVGEHLTRCARAIQAGVPLKGYFHWSLLDNFEWAFGYDMRFGMIYVDFKTQERIIKQSGHWYSRVIRDNGFDTASLQPW